MDISFPVVQYLGYRAHFCGQMELYIAEQMTKNTFEVIFKDNGEKADETTEYKAQELISAIQRNFSIKTTSYFHKGFNNFQIDISVDANIVVELHDFGHLLGNLFLEHREKEIVFTYLTKSGEFTVNSLNLLNNFSEDEQNSEEFLWHLSELLESQIQVIRQA